MFICDEASMIPQTVLDAIDKTFQDIATGIAAKGWVRSALPESASEAIKTYCWLTFVRQSK